MPASKPLAREASTVILLAFIAVELASILNVSRSSAASLPYPASLAISGILILFSLVGAYGVLRESQRGTYFSYATPLMEAILGLSVLTKGFVDGNLALINLPQPSLTIIFGVACFLFVSKTESKHRPHWNEQGTLKSASQPQADDYAVEVINVTKAYSVGSIVVPAVNGLTVKVRRGEFIAVMGPSGCGKSTLLNLIGALDRPTSGQVFIDGTDISTLRGVAQAQLRNQKVGFVFQAYNLINRSNVLRNVELPMLVNGAPREQRATRINEMLGVVGLESMASRRPKTLSGGEQQRVAIARAFVNSPKIVLADEPTGNLDSKSGMEILNFLRNTNKEFGTTVIMVTHNREAAEMADRIIYLRDGRIEKEEIIRRRPN